MIRRQPLPQLELGRPCRPCSQSLRPLWSSCLVSWHLRPVSLFLLSWLLYQGRLSSQHLRPGCQLSWRLRLASQLHRLLQLGSLLLHRLRPSSCYLYTSGWAASCPSTSDWAASCPDTSCWAACCTGASRRAVCFPGTSCQGVVVQSPQTGQPVDPISQAGLPVIPSPQGVIHVTNSQKTNKLSPDSVCKEPRTHKYEVDATQSSIFNNNRLPSKSKKIHISKPLRCNK